VGTQCEAPHNKPKVDKVEGKWAFADQLEVESVTSTANPYLSVAVCESECYWC